MKKKNYELNNKLHLIKTKFDMQVKNIKNMQSTY